MIKQRQSTQQPQYQPPQHPRKTLVSQSRWYKRVRDFMFVAFLLVVAVLICRLTPDSTTAATQPAMTPSASPHPLPETSADELPPADIAETYTPMADIQATMSVLQATSAAVESERQSLYALQTQQAQDRTDELHKIEVSKQLAELDRIASEAGLIAQDAVMVALDVEIRRGEATQAEQATSTAIANSAVATSTAAAIIAEKQRGMNIVSWSGFGGLALLMLSGVFTFGRFVYWRIQDGYTADIEADDEARKIKLEAELQAIAEVKAQKARDAKTAIVAAFVIDAILVNGEDDHQIPANTKMTNWNADRWQEAKDILAADGYAYASPQGTFLKAGTLGNLMDELRDGDYPANHSPTSAAERARQRYTQGIQKNRMLTNAPEYAGSVQNTI